MAHKYSVRTARFALRNILATALITATALLLGTPALAHDSLVSTSPEDGAVLDESPEALELTFSSEVLEVSPLIRITAESGELLEEIEPTLEGPVATAELSAPLPAGTHTVRWRVVSADGHPIEGTYEITIADEAPGQDDPDASSPDGSAARGASDAAPTRAPSDGGGPAQPAADDTDHAETTGAGDPESPVELVLGVAMLVVLVVAGTVTLILRRR